MDLALSRERRWAPFSSCAELDGSLPPDMLRENRAREEEHRAKQDGHGLCDYRGASDIADHLVGLDAHPIRSRTDRATSSFM